MSPKAAYMNFEESQQHTHVVEQLQFFKYGYRYEFKTQLLIRSAPNKQGTYTAQMNEGVIRSDVIVINMCSTHIDCI